MKRLLIILFLSVIITEGYSQTYVDYIDRINNLNKDDRQYDLCISSDKKFMAIATLSAIKIVDIQNFKIVKVIPVEFEFVFLVSFLSTNDKVLIVGNNKEETSAEIYSLSDKKLVKKVNPIVSGKINKSWLQGEFAKSDNYLVSVTKEKKIFILNCNTLEPIRTKTFTGGIGKCIGSLAISKDESLIAFETTRAIGLESTLHVVDVNGNLKYSSQIEGALAGISFSIKNELYISILTYPSESTSLKNNVYKINISSKKMGNITGSMSFDIKDRASTYMVGNDSFLGFESLSELVSHGKSSAFLTLFFLKEDTSITVPSYKLHYTDISFKNTLITRRISELSNSIYILPVGYENFSYIFDGKSKKLLGYFYNKGNNIAFISTDGQFTGDNEAISNLQYNINDQSDIPLVSQINQFYAPRLFNQILTSTFSPETPIANLSNVIKLTPELKIISPDSVSDQKTNLVNIRYNVKDNGDGVKEVRFYVNGKLLNSDIRGFKSVENYSQDIAILSGENIVEAVAVSNSDYQSSPDRIIVNYKGVDATTNLYILGVGIDQYKNSKYNLNYAVADAMAVVDYIKARGCGIFKNIDVKLLTDQQATKPNVVAELSRIAQQSNPTDVFIIYYAGHGVMSEGFAEVAKDYFMVLTDVSQMFGNDALLSQKGISAAELREFCKRIKAQKQVILLDACQSGGATETFAMRGASEEKAIIQLAQSTGVFLISSTGSEQFASEFSELKHGVFTYALLDGLRGAADGGGKDGKITIKELEAYLNDRIPELTQKYRGSMQFPNTWSRGMDFPIVVVGK
ncbi:hypothetical protein CYCD_24140 [Tenuifilaceae bacterium CYCD]|nr:hypothetical protein CYCD_24140 [Tenuifilaceae bacterium CYCD]